MCSTDITLISLMLMQVACLVNGDYIVEVRTHSYNNPRSLLANENCCDMLNGHCVVPGCDNVFYYCLRPIGSYSSGAGYHGGMLSHGVNNDDAPLNFSRDTVLGLPNPLPLLGLSAQWTVRNYRICLYLITAYYINMHTCTQLAYREFSFILKLQI